MKTHDFKVGDKVIINPDVPLWGKMPVQEGGFLTMSEFMRQPGVFTVKDVSTEGFIRLDSGYLYGPIGLLHAPVYEVGDVVMISDDCSCEQNIGVIRSIDTNCYAPTDLGEDGCNYKIDLQNGLIIRRSSSQFKLIESTKPIKSNIQENENQLQRKEVAVSRGDQHTGSCICCRRRKATITVGHLSYKEISGS